MFENENVQIFDLREAIEAGVIHQIITLEPEFEFDQVWPVGGDDETQA